MRPSEAAEILIRRREFLRKRIDDWRGEPDGSEGALDRYRAEYGALDVALDAIAEHRLIRAALEGRARDVEVSVPERSLIHARSACSDPDCEIHHPEVIEDDAERMTALAWFEAGAAAGGGGR